MHFSDRNSTAVCIYSIETIEDIFEKSSFKGYNKDVPHPRPGTVKITLALSCWVAVIHGFCLSSVHCVTWLWYIHTMSSCLETREGFSVQFSWVVVQGTEANSAKMLVLKILCRTISSHCFREHGLLLCWVKCWSRDCVQRRLGCLRYVSLHFQCVPNSRVLPPATISVVRDHPEMTDWVHSEDYSAPFYISSNTYTKIVVDQVQAADQRTYNVLFLSTGMWRVQITTQCCDLQSVFSCWVPSVQHCLQSVQIIMG